MKTFTAKKIVHTKKELINLFRNLQDEGYRWGNGDKLLFMNSDGKYIAKYIAMGDTEYCLEHLPTLLVFDAKEKRVYYSTFLQEHVEIDPNYR